MFQLNHMVVKSMSVLRKSSSAEVERHGKLGWNYFGYIFIHLIIISVAKEVQSQGLNHLEKSDIVQAVRNF